MGRRALVSGGGPVDQPDALQSLPNLACFAAACPGSSGRWIAAGESNMFRHDSAASSGQLRFASPCAESPSSRSGCANDRRSSTLHSHRIGALDCFVLMRCPDANGDPLRATNTVVETTRPARAGLFRACKQQSMLGDDRTAPAVVHANRPDVHVLAKAVDA